MLFHTNRIERALGKDDVVISCLFDGRFSISQQALIDNKTRKKYPFNDIDLENCFVTNVPLINDVHLRVSVLLLIALALRPIPNIADQKLLDSESGIKIVARSTTHVVDGYFYYEYSKPVMHGFYSTYAHPVGVSGIIVSAAGEFRTYSGEEIIPQKINDYVISATDDDGQARFYHAAELVLAAWSDDPPTEGVEQISFLNGNTGDFSFSNLASGFIDDVAAVVPREDSDPIYLKTK